MSQLFRTPLRFNQQRNGIPKIPKRSFEGRFPTSSEYLNGETSDTTKRYQMEARLPTSSDSSREEPSGLSKRYKMDERFDLLNRSYTEKEPINYHNSSRHQQGLYHEEEDIFSEDEDGMAYTKSTRIESPETHHTEEAPENRKRLNSSERNAWNPANLITNTCYNQSTGILLSKEQCKVNIESALKMKKDIDFYSILQLGNTPEHKTISFVLYSMNKLLKKTPKEDNPEIVPSFVFDEDASKEVEDEALLPGGVSLKIAMLLFPGISVNWVGRRAVSKAVLRILDLICNRDKYFLIYSSPDSDRPTTYPTLSLDFFTSFSSESFTLQKEIFNLLSTGVIQAGFRLPNDSSTLSAIIAQIRSCTRSYIEKRRSKKKTEVDGLFAEFQQLIEM
ncbi:hypothetical protein CRE_12919 [Caenorhabditis remanei]|uniref:Uncharacterized protein n=1 Tax=Caenorhabditis remanei TaxID=31234 RepID=E3N0Z6_CAERE|nr:hypothetical protein CRE_12919 [Caenorhabditis remanei]